MIFVIDASVAVRWFIEDFAHPHADDVLELLVKEPGNFSVPELFLYELYAVLQRHHPDAVDVFSDHVDRLMCSGVLRYPMTANIYTKANRYIKLGLTGYDSVYAALAEELDGKWITFDKQAHTCIAAEDISLNLYETSLRHTSSFIS